MATKPQPKKRPAKPKKTPTKFTGPLAYLVACRTRKVKATAWMPAVCYLSIDGEGTATMTYCGWAMTPTDAYPLDRLARDLWHLAEEWVREVGTCWRIEGRLLDGTPIAIPEAKR